MICNRCNQDNTPSKSNPHICEVCEKAENSRYSLKRSTNADWMQVAKEAELEIWERQPGETDREYQIWLTYRDAYPSTRPSTRGVAEQLSTTVNVVSKISRRWDFALRLQTWAKHLDGLILRKREQEIVDMNKQHVDMSKAINDKIARAIELMDPTTMKPSDIKGLLALTAELERKARLDDTAVKAPAVIDDNPELREAKVDMTDLSEIVGILAGAGLLSQIGGQGTVQITETKTTVIKGESDDEDEDEPDYETV